MSFFSPCSSSDDRESWLYRSTRDFESIANLLGNEEDDEVKKQDHVPSPTHQLKKPCDRLEIRKLSPKHGWKKVDGKWNEYDGNWIDCISPGEEFSIEKSRAKVIVDMYLVYLIVFVTLIMVVVSTFGLKDQLQMFFQLNHLPRCSLVLLIYFLLGFVCFLGGIIGDLVSHRGVIVYRCSYLAALSVGLLIAGQCFRKSTLYATGVALLYLAAGGLVPNIIIAGTAVEFTNMNSEEDERRRYITRYFCWGTCIHIASVHGSTALALSASLHSQTIVLFCTGVLLIVVLAWLRVATWNRKWPCRQLSSLKIWSTLRHHWLLMGSMAGVFFMISGVVVVISSLFVHTTSSIYGLRFLLSASGVSGILCGWVMTLVLSVSSFNPSYSVHKHIRLENDDEELFDSEGLVILHSLSIFPIGCMVVFVSIVRSQVYTYFVLQLCQTNLTLFGKAWLNPEYLGALLYGISIIIFPLLYRLLTVELQFFGRSTRLLHSLLLYVLASFISCLFELYRRCSSSISTNHWFPNTCQQATTSMSMDWIII
ncbi:hypothetical protein THRCLA_06479, partial [Thraustotheca clavata]